MTEKELDQADHIYRHGGDPMPTKPTDYKAEAFAWLGGRIFSGDAAEVENSLAALLERLCGEKDMEWREAFGVAVDMTPMQVADHVIALKAVQLAEAQEEIERLAKINELRSRIINRLPMCPDHRDKFKPEHCQACRAEKAESAIEQAREEGFRECDGQWQMAVGFAVTGMEREEAIAQVKEEGRREQREKALHERSPEEKAELLPRLEILSERLCQTQAYVLDALERAGLTVVPIREAKP